MLGPLNDRKLIGANGAPVEDDVKIQTIGPRGPAPLQDVWLIAK
ncbi:catalase [Burkholderia cepacia]|nr:catalase [Burkholderia cepacia]